MNSVSLRYIIDAIIEELNLLCNMACVVCGGNVQNVPCVVIEGGNACVHRSCYVCSVCGCSLRGYIMRDGRLVCSECCATVSDRGECCICGKSVRGRGVRIGSGIAHCTCSVCVRCGKPVDGSYDVVEGGVVCGSCLY